MSRVNDENIAKTYGLFRFFVFRFIRFLVRCFFPVEKNEELMEILYEDIKVRRMYINPEDFEPYDEYHSLYKGKYWFWIKSGEFGLNIRMKEEGKSPIFCQKIFDRESLPKDFRVAAIKAYEYRVRQLAKNRLKNLSQDFSFLATADAPAIVQEAPEEPSFGRRIEGE